MKTMLLAELMLSEERISRHLSRHSSFFSRSVPSYSEAVCRVCQAVLEDSEARTVVQHYEKLHPAASFASAGLQGSDTQYNSTLGRN